MELFIGIALLIVASGWAKRGFPGLAQGSAQRSKRVPVAYRVDPALHQAALDAYKHAVSEKMDVMRTAIQMGWGDDELKRLDARLEELIGKAELKRLIDGEIPLLDNGESRLDPIAELGRIRQTANG